jgi:GT2 family glycosyltransferase
MSGHPLVCVPVFGQFETTFECLRAIATHSEADANVLVIDDASPSRLVDHLPRDLEDDPRFRFHRNPSNLGFVGTANVAMTWSQGEDVVLVNSDVIVSVGWLQRLSAVASALRNVATVSVLADEASILSVRLGDTVPRVPDEGELASINSRLSALPPIEPPEIPVAIGHCLYVSRAAIEAVGLYDEAFAPGYGEEVDFALRCSAAGFRHLVAPNVFVLHRGSASFGVNAGIYQRRGAELLLRRYPNYDRMIRAFVGNREPLETLFRRVLVANGQMPPRGDRHLMAPGTPKGDLLFAMRRSVIGRLLLPPGGARARAAREFLRTRLRVHL